MKKLTTKRLILTPMSDEGLAQLAQTAADAHLRAAYGEMLAGCRAHPADRLWYTAWQIALKDGTPVGDLGFKGPAADGAVELGYGVAEAHRCRGYATEAAQGLLEWAFSQDGVYFVEAETAPDDEISQRVLQKLEFKPAGDGAEGPRFERERPASSWLALCMCFGLSLGLAFGNLWESQPIGMSMGMCMGVALGAMLDSNDKKKRDELRARRSGTPQPPEEE